MGTPLLGRYVVIEPIGRGGVSMVYHAVDIVAPRSLAVKILAPTLAGDDRARANVKREALITERLRHPSVPKVYAYGDAPLPDGTVVPYVVMELLSGVPLADRLATGRLPWREAVGIAATVADVLAVAHRRGVVHRDLTATNIMMTADGPKIIDFGLATATSGDAPARRPPILGPTARRPTLPRHPVTVTSADQPADDVYALGVLLYQMLTGGSPYPTATPMTFLAAGRFRCMAPTPVLTVPGLPREVADLCRRCMTKRREHRPSSVDVALDLWAMLPPDRTVALI
jgi:serine/threonine-protein kinase